MREIGRKRKNCEGVPLAFSLHDLDLHNKPPPKAQLLLEHTKTFRVLNGRFEKSFKFFLIPIVW